MQIVEILCFCGRKIIFLAENPGFSYVGTVAKNIQFRRKIMIDWNKAFPVLSITRNDLKEAGLTDAEIEALNDEDMMHIASKVEDCIDDEELEDHIFTSARNILDFGNMAL